MKINIEHCDVKEHEIIIRCHEVDEEVLHLLALLKSHNQKLCALDEKKELIFLSPNEVLYAETVDEKTFLYCKDQMYQVSLSLGELTSKYEEMGFFRIGKSAMVNIHQIEKLRSIAGGRIEVTLKSGEYLIVSRHYAPLFRQQLGV